ncbi:hypothetical protein BDY19DRAFT_901310 [Irpex rosettiformis]|uniref:Uncharacterized protein n=1 Tax=Irpex rosettiformis TaxID=378272 RepID=A0ACB8TLN7_9APHY|nr:hypothetical protein BDY19DRAFT_901310 [Irpex rosettiformis]
MSATLADIYSRIAVYPDLPHHLSLAGLVQFIKCASALHRDILLTQAGRHSSDMAPEYLPRSVEYFLGQVTDLSVEGVRNCWQATRELIWKKDVVTGLDIESVHLFKNFGHEIGLTCRTCYHHNFYVSNERCIYYTDILSVLQVSTHHFIEVQLIELWINSMLFAWTSASNCARLYNTALASVSPSASSTFAFSPFLQADEVWDAVICLCLLQDSQEQSTTLDVPHTGYQEDRFKEAMEERNVRFQQHGLPDIRHYCNKCMRFYDKRETGKVSAIVIDGITIGHPCCAVHNCQYPLASQRNCFCETHKDRNTICSINGCELPVTSDGLVCDKAAHNNMYRSHIQCGQSRFQLQCCLQEARASMGASMAQDNDEHGIEVDEEEFDVDAEGRFGRRRTHNDELGVGPCGMIFGRGTCYGSESLPSIVHFIKQLYRNIRPPEHIIYDNNCSLAKYVKDNPFFANIGLSVDVFHFNCKHSAIDIFCQQNCNPCAFPELIDENGGWFFNTSVAEQTNAWVGGYQSICREMHVAKYNFFLDKMIIRRNRVMLAKLEANGHQPGHW